MNCQEATERLPWWLNGTLDAEEHRQVEVHLAACPPCRAALAENRLAWEIFAQHIPAEALVAYAYGGAGGGLPPELLAAHLAECPQCREELELVYASRRLEEADEVAIFKPRPGRQGWDWRTAALAAGLAGLVAAGGWIWSFNSARDLSQQLAQARAAAPAGATLARLGEVEGDNRRLAATLQQMQERVKAAQSSVAQVQKTPPALPQAWANTAIVDASSDVLRGEPTRARTPVSFGPAELATVLLHPKLAASDVAAGHVLQLADAHGRRIWRLAGLQPDQDSGAYVVAFRRQPPGDYTLELDPGTAAAQRFPLTVR